VTPVLTANNITIPRELQNDCDTGDTAAAKNASAAQGTSKNHTFFKYAFY
jgi:hypothetical protein